MTDYINPPSDYMRCKQITELHRANTKRIKIIKELRKKLFLFKGLDPSADEIKNATYEEIATLFENVVWCRARYNNAIDPKMGAFSPYQFMLNVAKELREGKIK